MAKNDEKKVKAAEEAALAEQQIFGDEGEITRKADEVGVVQPSSEPNAPVERPAAPKGMSQNKPDVVTISREQFESFMNRLSDLEGMAMANSKEKDDIFNPLAEVKTDHVVKVAFFGENDELVVGYKEKQRPDGRRVYTWLKKDEASGEVRTYVTLLLRNKAGEIREETMDYVRFLEEAIVMDAVIKERKDIGKLVEQGLTTQMTWNGRTLVPTSTKIMTGAKEQKFMFKVLINGEIIELPENVVNIKS